MRDTIGSEDSIVALKMASASSRLRVFSNRRISSVSAFGSYWVLSRSLVHAKRMMRFSSGPHTPQNS